MQDFYLFPNLPLELRRKIWHCSLRLFPRIIEVRPRTTPTEAWDPLTTKHHVRATSPLVLLSINKEARKELLPFYTELSSDVSLNLILDSDEDSPSVSTMPPMVNFEIDAIYFNVAWDTTEAVPYLSFVQRLFEDFKQDKQLVRRLAVDKDSEILRFDFFARLFMEVGDGKDEVAIVDESAVREFNALEELVIVMEQTHLRVDTKLVALVDTYSGVDPNMLHNAKHREGQLLQGWRVPKMRFCSTVAERVVKEGVKSQGSYLERVYGPAFVQRFTPPMIEIGSL